jgi:hypothetical protein
LRVLVLCASADERVESRRKILEAKVSEYLERAEALHKLVAAPQPYPHPHPPVCDPSPRLRRVRVRVVPCPRSSRWLAGVCVCVCVCVCACRVAGFPPQCLPSGVRHARPHIRRRVLNSSSLLGVCCGCRRGCVCVLRVSSRLCVHEQGGCRHRRRQGEGRRGEGEAARRARQCVLAPLIVTMACVAMCRCSLL